MVLFLVRKKKKQADNNYWPMLKWELFVSTNIKYNCKCIEWITFYTAVLPTFPPEFHQKTDNFPLFYW